MRHTKIEYSNHTSNPIKIKGSRTFYCTKVSPGCKYCYAEVMSKRLAAMGGTTFHPYQVADAPPELELRRDILAGWAKRKKPEKIFVSSMTDVFGEFVPGEWIIKILEAMCAAPLQTFQVFTKRAARCKDMVDAYCKIKGIEQLPVNIWIIFTVEDQSRAEERIPVLINTKCSVRGLSCEPLLRPLELEEWLSHLDWVIVGGESGHHARPMHPDWGRSIRDQYKEASVAFWFKQWGEWMPWEHDAQPPFYHAGNGQLIDSHGMPSIDEMEESKRWDPGWWCIAEDYSPCIFEKVGKHHAGRSLDGVVYQEFPKQ